ncbi:MAG: energy transducer TonB [Lentimicrobium sp.]|nr:energy transducer TonB [Lentimicrobium sp.]
MKKFIQENLKYPEEALEKQIEGTVYLSYTVTNEGNVEDVRVIKGIGHGCDSESVRIISLLKYEAPHNRGMKVRSTMKTRISFRLPKAPAPVLNYELKTNEPKQKPIVKTAGSNVYGYTITFGNKENFSN